MRLWITLLFLVGGCHQDATQARLQEIVSGLGGIAELGSAYDAIGKTFTGASCLAITNDQRQLDAGPARTADKIDDTNLLKRFEGGARFDRNLDFAHMSKLLSGAVEVEVPVMPMISISGAANYAAESASTELSENFVLSYSLVGAHSQLNPDNLQVDSVFLEQLQGRSDPDNENAPPPVATACGQQFVSQIDYGGDFIVTAKIDYRNQFEREKFGGAVAAKLSLLGLSIKVGEVAVKFMNEEAKEGIKVTVSALQRGGDPNRIFAAIPFANGAAAVENGMNIVSCDFNNLGPCREIFNKLANYGLKDFPNQLSDPAKLTPVQYVTSDYWQPELQPPQPLGEWDAMDMRTKLKSLQFHLQLVNTDALRAQSLLGLPTHYYRNLGGLHNRDTVTLSAVIDTLQHNAMIYSEALRFCAENPGPVCIETADKDFLPQIQSYDRTALDVSITGFDQWCMMYEADKDARAKQLPLVLTDEEYNTVDAVMQRIGQSHGVKDCPAALTFLDATTELSLNRARITTLKPLASLINLRQIDLANNPDLFDLRPLQSFDALWSLDVSFTSVDNLAQFMAPGWEDLYELVVSAKQIKDSPLQSDPYWRQRHLVFY